MAVIAAPPATWDVNTVAVDMLNVRLDPTWVIVTDNGYLAAAQTIKPFSIGFG